MRQEVDSVLDRLHDTLDQLGTVAVAVSGGVDSMTLACAAHLRLGSRATMFHAVSPAVPPEATSRTRRHAESLGWDLRIVDAGEFSDPRYAANPVNRCYFCKTHLYSTIAGHTRATVVSGTNTDDLGDFRPGLDAAREHDVRHPFVEARIAKATVRDIARHLGLEDVAELPASPCLSSRIETGIRVDEAAVKLVHRVEGLLGRAFGSVTARCRVRQEGLVIELGEPAYSMATSGNFDGLAEEIAELGRSSGYGETVRIEPYRMGSAFLRKS